jgi:hypothetical protein
MRSGRTFTLLAFNEGEHKKPETTLAAKSEVRAPECGE